MQPAQSVSDRFDGDLNRRGSFLLPQNILSGLLPVLDKVPAAKLVLIDEFEIIHRLHLGIAGRVVFQDLFQFLQNRRLLSVVSKRPFYFIKTILPLQFFCIQAY